MAAKVTIFTFRGETDEYMSEKISTFLFKSSLEREQITIKQSQSPVGDHHTLTITLLYD